MPPPRLIEIGRFCQTCFDCIPGDAPGKPRDCHLFRPMPAPTTTPAKQKRNFRRKLRRRRARERARAANVTA